MRTAAFPKLAELQSLFWQLLTAPEGVASGAAELQRRGELADEDLAFLVQPDARMQAAERLDVYADMYFYRLRDCLAEDFPKLAARLGTDRFHNLVTDYLLAHPSSHYSLRELGRALPDYLAGQTLLAGKNRPGDRLLPDLARLEWARVDVFDETDAAPLDREALLAGGAEAEHFRLGLVPAARLLELDCACLPTWKQLDDSDEGEHAGDTTGSGKAAAVCVWRKGFAVLHRSLDPDEAGCLRRLAAGPTPLAELGESLLAAGDEAAAAERFAGLLARWTDEGLLIRAAPGPSGFVDTLPPPS